jgi:hypothetical protein
MPLWTVKNVDGRDRSHFHGNAPEFPLRNCRRSQRYSSRITGFRDQPSMKQNASQNIWICVTLSLILSVVCETLERFTYFTTLCPIRKVSGFNIQLKRSASFWLFTAYLSPSSNAVIVGPPKNKELPLPSTYFQFIIHFQRNFAS